MHVVAVDVTTRDRRARPQRFEDRREPLLGQRERVDVEQDEELGPDQHRAEIRGGTVVQVEREQPRVEVGPGSDPVPGPVGRRVVDHDDPRARR